MTYRKVDTSTYTVHLHGACIGIVYKGWTSRRGIGWAHSQQASLRYNFQSRKEAALRLVTQ